MSVHIISTYSFDEYNTMAVKGCKKREEKTRDQETTLVLLERRHANINM